MDSVASGMETRLSMRAARSGGGGHPVRRPRSSRLAVESLHSEQLALQRLCQEGNKMERIPSCELHVVEQRLHFTAMARPSTAEVEAEQAAGGVTSAAWMVERAAEELRALEAHHPHRFGCIKLELRAFIAHSSPPSAAPVATQGECAARCSSCIDHLGDPLHGGRVGGPQSRPTGRGRRRRRRGGGGPSAAGRRRRWRGQRSA